ncbi:MAG: hypothetical protein ABL907_13345, partial [Hyphomicrobium sp.]
MLDQTGESEIDSARAAYDEARQGLVSVASWMFVNGDEAADRLLTIADEFGADQATLRLLE